MCWLIGQKIAKFASLYPPQSHKLPSLGMTPFEFPITRMFGLSNVEELMMLVLFVLIQCRSVTDRQMDISALAVSGFA